MRSFLISFGCGLLAAIIAFFSIGYGAIEARRAIEVDCTSRGSFVVFGQEWECRAVQEGGE